MGSECQNRGVAAGRVRGHTTVVHDVDARVSSWTTNGCQGGSGGG